MKPFVSVVVPGLDCAATLESCLAALMAQSWPEERLELIYADSGSGDGSRQLAERWADRVVRVSGVPSAAATRNAGVAASSGEILVFIDADVVAPAGTIRALTEVLARDDNLAAVFGSYDAAPADPGIVSRYRNLLHHYVHQRSPAEAETFWSGCGAVRRTAFERVGGFDPECAIEDVDLGRRMRAEGYRIRLERDIQVKHLKGWTLASMVRTDVFLRGVPWVLLLLESGRESREAGHLNLTRRALASTLLAWTAGLSLLASPWLSTLPLAVLALAGVFVINHRFHLFLHRTGGARLALASLPLHLLHHACNGVSATIAIAYSLGAGSRGPVRAETAR